MKTWSVLLGFNDLRPVLNLLRRESLFKLPFTLWLGAKLLCGEVIVQLIWLTSDRIYCPSVMAVLKGAYHQIKSHR